MKALSVRSFLGFRFQFLVVVSLLSFSIFSTASSIYLSLDSGDFPAFCFSLFFNSLVLFLFSGLILFLFRKSISLINSTSN